MIHFHQKNTIQKSLCRPASPHKIRKSRTWAVGPLNKNKKLDFFVILIFGVDLFPPSEKHFSTCKNWNFKFSSSDILILTHYYTRTIWCGTTMASLIISQWRKIYSGIPPCLNWKNSTSPKSTFSSTSFPVLTHLHPKRWYAYLEISNFPPIHHMKNKIKLKSGTWGFVWKLEICFYHSHSNSLTRSIFLAKQRYSNSKFQHPPPPPKAVLKREKI